MKRSESLSGLTARDKKFSLYRASGMSMFPYIFDGEILIVSKAGADEIQNGDIILFISRNNTRVAHFVANKYVAGGKTYFQTKGRRGGLLDEPVSFEDVVGKVIGLKRLKMIFELDSRGRAAFFYRLTCFLYCAVYLIKKITGAGIRLLGFQRR